MVGVNWQYKLTQWKSHQPKVAQIPTKIAVPCTRIAGCILPYVLKPPQSQVHIWAEQEALYLIHGTLSFHQEKNWKKVSLTFPVLNHLPMFVSETIFRLCFWDSCPIFLLSLFQTKPRTARKRKLCPDKNVLICYFVWSSTHPDTLIRHLTMCCLDVPSIGPNDKTFLKFSLQTDISLGV